MSTHQYRLGNQPRLRLLTLFLLITLVYALYVFFIILQNSTPDPNLSQQTKTAIESATKLSHELSLELQKLPANQPSQIDLPISLVNTARARKHYLVKLMRQNPDYFYHHLLDSLAIPTGLKPAYQLILKGRGLLEQHVSASGRLTLVEFHAPQHSQTSYMLDLPSGKTLVKHLRLYFVRPPAATLRGVVTIRGVGIGADVLVSAAGLAAWPTVATPATSKKTVLVMLLGFKGDLVPLESVADIERTVFGQTSPVTQYFAQRNLTIVDTLSGSRVVGPYTLPTDAANCMIRSIDWADSADRMAAGSGINLDAYDLHVYVFPKAQDCAPDSWSQVAGTRSWINGMTTADVYIQALSRSLDIPANP